MDDGWQRANSDRSTGRYVSVSLKDGRFRVAISPDILKTLDWHDKRIGVHFGAGDNLGKVRVMPDTNGYWSRRGGKSSLTLRVSNPIGLRQDAPTQRTDFEVVDGAVIVTLPPEYLAE